jgi:hypothetical protein
MKATKKAAKKKAVRRVRRSARSGQFVTEADTKRSPETTVTETVAAAKAKRGR